MPLDIQQFRAHDGGDLEVIKASEKQRYNSPDRVDQIVALDEEWRKTQGQIDSLNRDKRATSKKIGAIKKAKGDASELMAQVTAIKEQQKDTEAKLEQLASERTALVGSIGNLVHESVPVSNNEDDNEVVAQWGDVQETPDAVRFPYHHHQLLYMIGGYEPERGSRIAGHRGYFLTGPGVMLNEALKAYGLKFLRKKGFTPMAPPLFMNKGPMSETAQLSDFHEALYKVTGEATDEEKYLIATSEQPISAFHRGETLAPSQLPIRYAGTSVCFRKEAGKHGKDASGIFRVHQFDKIEQFCITDPETSWQMHDEMIEISKQFYQTLNIPYRVVNIISGELNNAAAKKYDLEGWYPTLGRYKELVSCSNCTDYQSRAMNTRFGQKSKDSKEKKYVHMLNSTLCATTRVICAILENFQQPEREWELPNGQKGKGGVQIPEPLRVFMDDMDFMPFVNECPINKTDAKMKRAAAKKAAGKK